MTSKDKHQKHVALARPTYGDFGRNELAILGTSCGTIQELVNQLSSRLNPSYQLAYVDKEHGDGEGEELKLVTLLEKDKFSRLDTYRPLSPFDKRRLFKSEDLVLINGNHFAGKHQIVVIDPNKNLEKKIDRLTDVQLILLKDPDVAVPDILKEHLPNWQDLPLFNLSEIEAIAAWVRNWLEQRLAPVKGLVLAGGESKRMQKDKGELVYHDKYQREHVLSLIQPFCSAAYLSCNATQTEALGDRADIIEDVFLKLGPMGGILSAFRSDPNAAWLTVACDLPYLSEETLQYLVEHRNPSKVATAFLDSEGIFPEPLVTLWEPRAYPILLEYLSQGYSCPRKVLINADVELLIAPRKKDFYNANRPEEYEKVITELSSERGKTA
jgi:molybdopterin-guanine dinucleotide biosynthesis protein A